MRNRILSIFFWAFLTVSSILIFPVAVLVVEVLDVVVGVAVVVDEVVDELVVDVVVGVSVVVVVVGVAVVVDEVVELDVGDVVVGVAVVVVDVVVVVLAVSWSLPHTLPISFFLFCENNLATFTANPRFPRQPQAHRCLISCDIRYSEHW